MDDAKNDRDYGIAIGFEHYKDARSKLTGPIRGPIEDVTEFKHWLLGEGGLREENYKEFLSQKDYTPNQIDIDEWISKELLGKLRDEKKQGRRLYFYFSGHGIGTDQQAAALLLPRWSSDTNNYALSSNCYLKAIRESGLFEEIFFFLDCCRNRIPRIEGLPPSWVAKDTASNLSDFMIFYATEFDDSAYEAPLAGKRRLDNGRPRGFFTEVLINGLKGAAAGPSGQLKLVDLFRYLKWNVPKLAGKYGKYQNPKWELSADPDKVINEKRFPKRFDLSIRFPNSRGEMILYGPDADEIHGAEIDHDDCEWRLTLSRGRHLLCNKSAKEEMDFFVDGIQDTITYEECILL